MDLKEIEYESVDWDHVALHRGRWRYIVNTDFIKGREFFDKLHSYQLLKKDSALRN
jgi:hypothetical protein